MTVTEQITHTLGQIRQQTIDLLRLMVVMLPETGEKFEDEKLVACLEAARLSVGDLDHFRACLRLESECKELSPN